MSRKAAFLTFREAAEAGPYDESPVLVAGVDPQVHISRNDRLQPFFLTCEKDNVLVQMSGSGRLHVQKSAYRYVPMKAGDHVYLPAGVPHRYEPEEDSVQLRYKAETPGLERIHWDCEACGTRLHAVEWDTADELPQEGYLRGCGEFNASAGLRTCSGCGAQHAEIDLTPYRWSQVADELRGE